MSIPRASSSWNNPRSSQESHMEKPHPNSCPPQTSANTRDSAENDFSKHMTESIKLADGPPARYQLKLERLNVDRLSDKKSKLRKFTLGKRDPKYQNKSVLLVGETGSGKSTLINAMVNFVMGVKFKDNVWFEVIADDKNKSETESKTSEVSVYEIFGFEGKIVPFSLTIIDTPGYGDTRGIEYDVMTLNNLLELFIAPDGVKTLNAVGLVVKATQNRLDERITYIFNSITSLFDKGMEKNIVAMMTHSDGMEPKNALQALEEAEIKYARDGDNEPVYFQFNNCQKEKVGNGKRMKNAAHAFGIAEDGMSEFTEFLDECEPQLLEKTIDVMSERMRLKACIENFKERVMHIEKKQEAIRENKEELENLKEEISNLNSRFNKTITYKDIEKCEALTLSCLKCEETCKGSFGIWGFSLFWLWKYRCSVCSGRCPRSDHVHERWRYVTKSRKIKVTIEEMKKKYEAEAESKEKKTLVEHLQEDMEELQRLKNKCLDDAFEAIEKLEEIALNSDSVSTYVHLDFLIDKMKEREDAGKVAKLEGIKTKIEKKSKGGAGYFMRRLQQISNQLCQSAKK